MAQYTFTHTFAAPPEEVFRLAWDLDVQRQLDPRLVKFEIEGGGEPRPGSRLVTVMVAGHMAGSSSREIVSIDGEGPERGAVTVQRAGVLKFCCQSRYEPCEEGTRVTLEYTVSPANLLGYLAIVFFMLLGRFTLGREVRTWFQRMERGLADGLGRPAVAPQVRAAGGGVRCPYCHTDTEPAQAVACTHCFARHHEACWDEHTECAACGNRTRFTAVEETEGRTRAREQEKKEKA